MERMINLSGESAINRSRIEMGISSLSNNIEEMGATVQRLADQLRRMETELEIQILSQIGDEHALESDFDPLEMDQYSALNQLSKSLSESASDLLDIKTTMLDKTRETENLLLQLSRTQTDLQEGLMDSRTVPFSRITPRLQRIVRQTATELGKSVELRILNDEGEIDRNILERITSPLEHMLRNAVDHGIEKSQERIESGKSRTGLITLEVLREGGEIVINLIDDGRGINVNAVRQKAIEQGLISAKDTSLKTLDIMQYIFNAGLSTAKSVSQISGRGVGMDVVQSEVKQLGGVVTVDSESGRGSRFTMRLPLTVAVSDALMVRAGDKYFAVPLVQIERVMRVNIDAIANFYTKNADSINIDGQAYRLRYLNQILYGSDPVDALAHQSSSVPVIIIRTDLGQRMALQVDMIAGSRIEVVVKPLGRQLSHIDGISAATIMGDGSVMLILDLVALMRNVSNIAKVEQQKANKSVKQAHKPLVLIVDDSVTVRKVTSRLLERNGYEAQVATDGIDALEKLQEMLPEVIVLDIEMPRMDGFEVANHIRHNPRLQHIPIVMITSRTGEKHRERAFGIGVNEYMGKPFQEQMLLDTLARFTQQAKTD
jgi:chemosensory pili system protein ChpA (sensor histidine kinase/response regulator)